jgi:hypothetical protein
MAGGGEESRLPGARSAPRNALGVGLCLRSAADRCRQGCAVREPPLTGAIARRYHSHQHDTRNAPVVRPSARPAWRESIGAGACAAVWARAARDQVVVAGYRGPYRLPTWVAAPKPACGSRHPQSPRLMPDGTRPCQASATRAGTPSWLIASL